MEKVGEVLDYVLLTIKDKSLTVFDVFLVIAILVSARLLLWATERILNRRLRNTNLFTDGRLASLIQLIKYFAYTVAVVIALESIGLNITLLLAGSAALLVGVGLGLQEVFRDVVSGIIILFEGNIKLNDIVEINELLGKVRKINLRTCEIETRDSTIILVPNSRFVSDRIINWSHNYQRTRFAVSVGVSYGSDVRKVEKVLLQCAEESPDVLKLPKPFVKFTDFGDSSLNFQLHYWSDKIWVAEVVKSDLRFAIARAFKENQIHIPFPQLDLHVRSDATK